MASDDKPSRPLRDVAEDATGFGSGEVLMTRDLILRPHDVAAAQGRADNPYPRAFRYFLTLNGVYLALIAATGGFQGLFAEKIPAAYLDWAVEASGKSQDAFLADLDQWYTLSAVPLISLAFYLPLAFLFRRWGQDRAAANGQAFVYISGWSLYGAPLALLAQFVPAIHAFAGLISFAILTTLFVRMGRDLWWSRAVEAVWKFALLLLALLVGYIPGVLVVGAIAFTGAVFGP